MGARNKVGKFGVEATKLAVWVPNKANQLGDFYKFSNTCKENPFLLSHINPSCLRFCFTSHRNKSKISPVLSLFQISFFFEKKGHNFHIKHIAPSWYFLDDSLPLALCMLHDDLNWFCYPILFLVRSD